MTRITNADQVLLLLRAHLERSAKMRGKAAAADPGRVEARKGPLERVQHMAGAEHLTEHDVSRALVAGLLAEEFGEEVASEPRFQELVDNVLRLIAADEEGRALVRDAVAQLVGR